MVNRTQQGAGGWLPPARLLRWHRRLALLAGLALVLWAGSGLLHPLLTFTGPQQQQFAPPRASMDLEGARPPAEILAAAEIESVRALQVVAGPEGPLLQATLSPSAPRHYFDPFSGKPLPEQDARQAEWLARHYLDLPSRPLQSLELVTGFDGEYPWVNRLLPVWRVAFAGDDGLVAFVHTETAALAYLTNDYKSTVQRLFRLLHTWSWVPPMAEWLRVLLISLLIGSIVLMATVGLLLRQRLPRRRPPVGVRRWHRAAAWLVGVPLLMLTLSGLYHLWQRMGPDPEAVLSLAEPMPVERLDYPLGADWQGLTDGLEVRGVSFVERGDGQPLYRFALARPQGAPEPRSPDAIRQARFAGVQPTGPAVYLEADTGTPWQSGDRQLALELAGRFSGLEPELITDVSLVTGFGPDYDFRNKRLPVWRIDYGAPAHRTLFIDTAIGALVESRSRAERREAWSFSLLHKWNFLRPLGHGWHNAVVVLWVSAMALLFAGVGLWLRLRRRARPSARSSSTGSGPTG